MTPPVDQIDGAPGRPYWRIKGTEEGVLEEVVSAVFAEEEGAGSPGEQRILAAGAGRTLLPRDDARDPGVHDELGGKFSKRGG